MAAYYNETDPFAAAWLRELIKAGHIAPGEVDERSIADVMPSDIAGFTQCHFFAGIGVWSYALRQAGWPDDRSVWTGSCPCQPFSAAGAGAGFADKRHLWPAMFHLIEQCKPAVVFGEQVASKDANPWIDLVQTDLEAVGYGVGAIAFPSASVGAPHIRDRLYWVADSGGQGLEKRKRFSGVPGWKACAVKGQAIERGSVCTTGGLADANCSGRIARGLATPAAGYWDSTRAERGNDRHVSPRPTNGFWRDADWLLCRDGKWRAVEPGTFPLAHGAPARVGRLRGYGNAINAEQAKSFIEAFMETTKEHQPCPNN